MKSKLLAFNWKSNKTKYEAKIWLIETSSVESKENLEVVVFPPFTLLDTMSGYTRVNSLPFQIGAQDISPFNSGAFTGEVSGEQIKEFADYVIIGHSERRTNFLEDKEIINKKIEQALENELKIILCISKLEELPDRDLSKIVIAYEPLNSIGNNNPADLETVVNFSKVIKSKGDIKVIYGGSVSAENVKKYLDQEIIDGVLVGGESLDPKSFINIIQNAI